MVIAVELQQHLSRAQPVQGVGCGVDLGCRVQGVGCRVKGLGSYCDCCCRCNPCTLWFRVQGLGLRIQGLGCRDLQYIPMGEVCIVIAVAAVKLQATAITIYTCTLENAPTHSYDFLGNAPRPNNVCSPSGFQISGNYYTYNSVQIFKYGAQDTEIFLHDSQGRAAYSLIIHFNQNV